MRVFGLKTLMRNESKGGLVLAEVGIRVRNTWRHYRPIDHL